MVCRESRKQKNPKEMVRQQGAEIKKVENFKYIGSTVHSNRKYGRKVKKCVSKLEWVEKVSGVMWDKRITARVKGKVYKW